jgi:hypothetical protein
MMASLAVVCGMHDKHDILPKMAVFNRILCFPSNFTHVERLFLLKVIIKDFSTNNELLFSEIYECNYASFSLSHLATYSNWHVSTLWWHESEAQLLLFIKK